MLRNRPTLDRGGERLRAASASMVREVYEQEVEGRNLRVTIRQDAPDALMARLLDVLRDELQRFIDPDTDRIGHAFPIEGGSAHHIAHGNQDLVRWEYYSELQGFARALVQAAAVSGVQSVVARLAGWCQGEPLEVRMATVLSGLILSDAVALEGDVELVPLGLSTAELPRLPMFWGDKASDYLGLTLLRLGIVTLPVLFQPVEEENGGAGRSRSAHALDLDLVRDALSLVANRNVALSRVWLEYPTAGGFCLSGPSSTMGTDRPIRRHWKVISSSMGTTTVTPPDDVTTDCG